MTGIPMLAGWGDELANTLPQLGSGIAHIINPQLDQQMALKSAMIKDPALLQQFATIERNNPGTMERMGFGKKFGNIIGGIGESEEETLNKQQKRATIEKTKAETTEAGARTSESQARAIQLGSESDLEKAQTRLAALHIEDLGRDNEAKANLFRAIPDLANKNIAKIAADFSIGKVDDPKVIARIQADPQYGPVFESLTKNIMERAKLALEKNRLDKLDKSEKMVALRYAISNQREAEQRLTALQTLQRKYGSMDQQHLTAARMLAQSKPDSPQAQELVQYDQMVANGNVDIENAKKDAKTSRALTMGAFRQNPEFKNTLDQLDRQDQLQEASDAAKASADRVDPIIVQARQAIHAAGLETVKQSSMWKKLTPAQQRDAQGLSNEPDTPNTLPVTTPVNKKSTLPISDTTSIKDKAKGPGQGSSISGSKLTPYDVMQMQMRDIINGREVGDYSDSVDPVYKMQQGPQMNFLTPSTP